MQPPSYSDVVGRVDRGGRLLAARYPNGVVPANAFLEVAKECDLPLMCLTNEEVEAHPVSRALYVAGFCRDAVLVLQQGYDAVEAMFVMPVPVRH